MKFEPTAESLSKHEVPQWYNDAKFGIFIHWALFSVPAFAENQGKSLAELSDADSGFGASMKYSPYAEWYLNSSRIPGSPTNLHHKEVYGEDFNYFDFDKVFEEKNKTMDADKWADFFQKAGAKYVVLVTKHHEGYCLWPSKYKNPQMPEYQSKRDLVGEITDAVRKRGMKMGLYYSGIFDWTFKDYPIDGLGNWVEHHLVTQEYCDYATNQTKELIERYKPSVLWNDIGYPPQEDLYKLIADYYNEVPDGVINDRWRQYHLQDGVDKETQKKAWIERLENELQGGITKLLTGDIPVDFNTPEYEPKIVFHEKKWEMTRGMGMSFGYNQTEGPDKMLTSQEIITMLADVVSKNGNLLLNIGPMADGTIPEMQMKPLLEVGKWLKANGESIYGTRYCEKQEAKTASDKEVRFTQKDDALYVSILNPELDATEEIMDLQIPATSKVTLLGSKKEVSWSEKAGNLVLQIPEHERESVYVFKIA